MALRPAQAKFYDRAVIHRMSRAITYVARIVLACGSDARLLLQMEVDCPIK